MILTALLLLVLAAVVDKLVGIMEPWRKLIYIVLVILVILGLVNAIAPGLGRSFGLD